MNAKGSVFKYPDNVDTDVIIPARHLNTQDAKELASHCMEDIDKDFVKKVKDGDIMVGGWNFGCGSSREHQLWRQYQTVIIAVNHNEGTHQSGRNTP